jgi:serine/threonine protein kinase
MSALLGRSFRSLAVHPSGATLARGAYVVSSRCYAGPWWGIYRGFAASDPSSDRMLVTITRKQTRSYDALASRLSLLIPGVTPLLHVGPVTSNAGEELDGLVEWEPPGTPMSEIALPLPPSSVSNLVKQIATVLDELHRAGFALGGLQPELIYARPSLRGLTLTGLVPRSTVFALTASTGADQVPPFPHIYLPPESSSARPRPAADVFSLCALAAHWLSGHHPFRGVKTSAQLLAIARGERRPWLGPEPWGRLIDRGLNQDVSVRPPLPELLHELESIAHAVG